MATYWYWWGLAAVLVGAELVTGTFYLAALAVAFGVGGVVAWFGGPFSAQLLIAGALSVAGTFAAHRWRLRRGAAPPDESLDVGQTVRIAAWKDDGTARVIYRGTQWDAELATPASARAETMVIVGTRGSRLIIADRLPEVP